MSELQQEQLTEEQLAELKNQIKQKVIVNRQMKRQSQRQERSNLSRQLIPERKFVGEFGVVVTIPERVIWHQKLSKKSKLR